ncbi:penicillin-binding protein 2 [Olivibacter sp. SDN3]|uniref:penicillin-binding protein 2 n=1 Tax=Olivibacter sp. SDN3 TaxID=2764720 RepID=UPI0021066FE7|nr:penicillin-binding protein 2 [Olivibacter sp. SDN3]
MNSFFERKYVIQGIFITAALLLALRLFYLQIIDDSYLLSANNNVLRKVVIYPARGVILDRTGKILVQNEPVYDLMVTPREVKSFDTLALCELIGVDKEGFDKRFQKAVNFSPYRASVFEKQLSAQIYARLQEKLYQFRGFYVQNRTVRSYPDSVAAQFLGYINEVTPKDIERSNNFYRPGDYIGVSGVERAYEDLLRGQRGVQNLMVDAFNRPKGHFMDGKYDTLAVAGEGLVSSLDLELQKLAEKLMKNKRGSVVAIEPSTGEILAFSSTPSYDPNMMVGRERGNNYMKLLNDPNKPMFIRPIQAQYPPGSVFKVVSALVSQQAGMIEQQTRYHCPGGYSYGGGRGFMRCTHVHGTIDLPAAIQGSCNTYFGHIYARMLDQRKMRASSAYTLWREAIMKFGIAQELGVDLPNEKKGLLPTADYYSKRYGNEKWGSGYNISNSIGQGEVEITTLQMANIMAIVANRGYYYRPHLIKSIGEEKVVKKEFTEKISVDIDEKYFEPVVEGMSRVVKYNTNIRIPDIEMCGKTGTAQNPHGKHHSVFFAFAPRVNPKIAIAVFVENVGYGATYAAPIASMMVEKYLKDTISMSKATQERVLKESNLIEPEPPKEETEQVVGTSAPFPSAAENRVTYIRHKERKFQSKER